MARTGKIARLPWHIRHRLNQRLDENETSETLLQWLNDLPPTKEVLELYFDSQPITEVNLTAWRNGGYQDWLEDQRGRELVERLAEQAKGADELSEGRLSEHLAVLLTMRLAGLMQKLLAESENNPPEKQWQYAKELSRELDRVRRSDHRCRQLQLREEERDWEQNRQDRQDQAQADKDKRKKRADNLKAAAMIGVQAQYYGTLTKSPKLGEYIAKSLFAIEHDGPMPADDLGDIRKSRKANEVPGGKGKADPSQKDGKAPVPAMPSKDGAPACKEKKASSKKKTITRQRMRKAGTKEGSQKSGVAPKQEDAAGDAPGAKANPAEPEAPSWGISGLPTEQEDGAGESEAAGGPEPGAEAPDPEGSL